MSYYKKRPLREFTGYCVIEVTINSDFTAYIKSCIGKSVRYAYTKLSAKPFENLVQATEYVEKNLLRKRFPLGCKILVIPAAGESKKSA